MNSRIGKFILLAIFLVHALPSEAAISKYSFHRILNLAQHMYSITFEERDQRLYIDRMWHSDNEKASSWLWEDRQGEVAVIRFSGGIARHPETTDDSFALIVCHEIGHHLAGGPTIWKFSAEGQADYFGASECMRKIIPALPGYMEANAEPAPGLIQDACNAVFEDPEEQHICSRIAKAGEALSRFFAAIKSLEPPRFSTPDSTIVDNTITGPASPQCRLDTYLAAALCDHSEDSNTPWLCDSKPLSARPACWYHDGAS